MCDNPMLPVYSIQTIISFEQVAFCPKIYLNNLYTSLGNLTNHIIAMALSSHIETRLYCFFYTRWGELFPKARVSPQTFLLLLLLYTFLCNGPLVLNHTDNKYKFEKAKETTFQHIQYKRVLHQKIQLIYKCADSNKIQSLVCSLKLIF